ncbi:MAG: hypothetical protein ACK5QT_09190 [Oligoflexia bacterium]
MPRLQTVDLIRLFCGLVTGVLTGLPGLAPSQAIAADFRSPRTVGLGGAGRANPILNDAIYLNPSFVSFLPVYSWSANFKALREGRGRAYNASVLDGRSELFQAGLAYQVRDNFTALHLSGSRKITSNTTAGVGAKLFFSKDPSALSNFRDFTASVTHAPLDWLQVSAIIENIDRGQDSATLGLERELILGTRFKIAEKFSIFADPHFSLEGQRPRGLLSTYEIGAEMAIFQDLYLRLGRFKDSSILEINRRADGYGVGLGWVTPRISIDFGLEHIQSPVNQISHTTGATLYF